MFGFDFYPNEGVCGFFCFFFQAEDGIRDLTVTGVQTCALPIWGVPAVDLAQQLTVQSGQLSANPDVSSYWSAGREGWPDLSSEACWRLAYCGTVFRTLSAMSWIADDLANDWAHASLRDTRLYAAELEAALQRLDWVGRPSPPQREVAAT